MRRLPVVPRCRSERILFFGNYLQISGIIRAVFVKEGRFAIVTNVERGMRWTRWPRQTSDADADGEVVWS
jgi:hypothetical protein